VHRNFPEAAKFPDLARGGHHLVHSRLTARMSITKDQRRRGSKPGLAAGRGA